MCGKVVSGMILTLLLVSTSALTFELAKASSTIYAQTDGIIERPSAPKEPKIIEHKITFSELQRLKKEIGVYAAHENYNKLIDGHGTGWQPPTEEEWAQIVDTAFIIENITLDGILQTPTDIDHSTEPWFPPIGNQDGEGSCTTWSIGYYMKTFQEAREHGWDLSGAGWEGGYQGHPTPAYQDKIFSPDFIYHLINDGKDEGSNIYRAINLVCSIGACSWKMMPYDPTDHTSWPSEEAWKEAPYYRGNSSGYETIGFWDNGSLTSLKNWIASGNLAEITVDAHKYTALTSQDIWTLDNYLTPDLNHANTIVGYSDSIQYMEEGALRQGAFKIANSWGVGGWEKVSDGCYWISYEAMKQRVHSCTIYSDRIGYEPDLLSYFRLDHPKRNECSIDIGMGSQDAPIATKMFWLLVSGGSYPFCPNNIVLDITEFKDAIPNTLDQSFFIRVYDWGTSATGTILYFAIEDSVSSSLPIATVDQGYVFVYLDPVLQQDGFESGSFGAWTGTNTSTGETATVVNTLKHHGTYSGRFTSNGGGGVDEYSYCYKTVVSSSELYGRGYFFVSQATTPQDGSRFFFMIFTAGNDNVAFAGWRRIGGVVRWTLTTRNGTKYVDVLSSISPSKGRWYCVELHWKGDSANGLAEMYIGGKLICSSYGINTTAFGDVTLVQLGLPKIMYCGATRAHCDCAKIATAYIGPELETSTLTVTSPNGGESWVRGTTHAITWTSTGSVGAYVKIEILKGGVVKATAPSTANDGYASWTIGSAYLGTDYRVRITSTSNPAITDTSDSDFTITADGGTGTLTVTSPNGGESWVRGTTHPITWTSSGSVGSYVKIEILKSGVVKGAVTTANDGSYSWTISSSHLGTDYRVRITSTSNPAITDSSDGDFAITAGGAATLTVTSPNGGEVWVRGTAHDITWTSSGSVGSSVKIEVLKSGVVKGTVTTANDGSYSWTIGTSHLGTDYKIRITSTSNPAITDSSDNYFTIIT